jgi:alpha-L-fucosidase
LGGQYNFGEIEIRYPPSSEESSMSISRRTALKALAAAGPAAYLAGLPRLAGAADAGASEPPQLPPAPAPIPAPEGFGVAEGPFQPTLESLSNYQLPDWYRDVKFGIWAHWGPQCQPEMGDWYGQRMYKFKDPDYEFQIKNYGHPSKAGFKEVINSWKADQWDPAYLIGLYKKAGAKFFAALAHHHDNFDNFDSTYQPWNSVNMGPKKSIVGGWEKVVRDAGLRFAISSHGDRAWSWYQNAQLADPSGPLAGVHYDGLLSKDQGKGTWWEGYDPQDLYAQYHALGKYNWPQQGNPPIDKAFCEKFFNRIIDLINKHNPDLLYFDDTIMPIYPTCDVGPRIAAYLYNHSIAKSGKLDVVMTGKQLKGPDAVWRKALLLDLERGVSGGGETIPWQTDTCIGDWHYRRSLFEDHKYKSPTGVIQMLIDIVSKNGNLMLNIPVRGNGTIDDDEIKVLSALTDWIGPNGEAIYETRPFVVYGEGPSTAKAAPAGHFGGVTDVRKYSDKDIRYTTKGETVYAFVMGWPENSTVTLTALATGAKGFPKNVGKVELLGSGAPVTFNRDDKALTIKLPSEKPNDIAYALKISPA